MTGEEMLLAKRQREENDKLLAGDEPIINEESPTIEDYDLVMELHLKEERAARGYTTREPTEYLASSVERWASDATDWVAHVDEVMLYALSIINAVKDGEEPPTIAEFRAGLPKITWSFNAD